MQIENYGNVLGQYNFNIADLPLEETVDWNGRKVSQHPSSKYFISCKDKESGGGSVTIKGGGDSDGNSHLGAEIEYKGNGGGPSVSIEGKVERHGGETRASGEGKIKFDFNH